MEAALRQCSMVSICVTKLTLQGSEFYVRAELLSHRTDTINNKETSRNNSRAFVLFTYVQKKYLWNRTRNHINGFEVSGRSILDASNTELN